MNKDIKFSWRLSEEKAEKDCPNDCIVVPMRGYSRMRDFYKIIPKKGLFFKSSNCAKYGEYTVTMFVDGKVIYGVRQDKIDKLKKLYNFGNISDLEDYARGHRLWRETELGGNKINKYKEAARISHYICDMRGEVGHRERQRIRADILY